MIRFAEKYLKVPEGMHVGQPLMLDIFQKAFILAVFDGGNVTEAYLSIARRNGKTFVIAVILLAFIIGPLKERNTTLCSAAMSRDQAAAVFELMVKMLDMSPELAGTYKYVLSSKQITGLKENVQYRAISSDAKTGHGKAYKVILLDEAGQIDAESNAFVEMLTSSQSNYEDPLFIIISTQAPSDASYFSIQLDHAETANDPNIVSPSVHHRSRMVICLMKSSSRMANPGLGMFRSHKEMNKQAAKAKLLPSAANGILNLNYNRRVSLASIVHVSGGLEEESGACGQDRAHA